MVYDKSPEAIRAIVNVGAKSAASVAEVAGRADVLFTSLPGPPQVEEVILGPQGVMENMRPGLTLFELSTSSVSLARRIYEAFKQRGAFMLDAPVSGGPAGAASGDLALWIGGDKDVYERNLELIHKFADKPCLVGPIGAGTVTKLANNMLGCMILLSQAEVFSMAVKAGIDPLDLWQALRLGVVGKSSVLNMLINQFLPGQYEPPAFAMKLIHKDVMLATSLAMELGVPMRLANLTLEEMTEALTRGFGEQDSRSFLKLQLERAGVQIAVDPNRLREAVNSQ